MRRSSATSPARGRLSLREVLLARIDDLDVASVRRHCNFAPAIAISVALIRERVAAVDVEDEMAQLIVERVARRAHDAAAGRLRDAIEERTGFAEDDGG